MRDPHRLLRTVIYVLTPIGYAMAAGYQLAKAFRDVFHTSTKEPTT